MKESNLDCNDNSNDVREETREVLSLLALSKEQQQQLPQFQQSIISTVDYRVHFANLTKLDLFQANLDENSLPSCLPTYLPNLKILFCMKNNFKVMPSVLSKFPNLTMVSFKSNFLQSIHPDALSHHLQWLILTDNQLTTLPTTIGKCTKLQKLMLSGNMIKSIPQEILQCRNLELVRLSSNQLKEPPMNILSLPNLAWVALSDNPFLTSSLCSDQQQVMNDVIASSTLRVFPNDDLDDPDQGVILGKGASGITRKYTIPRNNINNDDDDDGNNKNDIIIYNNDQYVDVAVKEFYSNITSDGNPQIERLISFTIATKIKSKSLIKVLGQTKKGNLVMELLSNYEVLANPPSLQSCSRDVYDHYFNNDHKMKVYVTYKRIVYLIHNLLYTLKELHMTCGIMHGDFYGHNILFSKLDEGQIWLTDFGAAFFYDRHSEYGPLIEKIERRAFGHLLKEIILYLMKFIDGEDKGVSTTKIETLQQIIQNLIGSCEDMTFEQLYSKWSIFFENAFRNENE